MSLVNGEEAGLNKLKLAALRRKIRHERDEECSNLTPEGGFTLLHRTSHRIFVCTGSPTSKTSAVLHSYTMTPAMAHSYITVSAVLHSDNRT